jgi:hypothetical protein
MIERHWKGVTKPENSDKYVQHLLDETFPALSAIEGFKTASVLKRNTELGVEFLIVTKWESMEAIKKFAGENAEISVVPLKVQKMMVTFDRKVCHYVVAEIYDTQKIDPKSDD